MPGSTDIGKSAAHGEPDRRDRAWINQFTLQMDIQRAAADDISRAVADVRAHCAERGQSAYEAFGDPRSYATKLAAELPTGRSPFGLRSVSALFLSILACALLLVGWASFAQLRDDQAPVTLGTVLFVTVVVPVWVAMSVTPWGRRRPRDPATPDQPAFDEKYWRALWFTVSLAAVGAALWIGLDQALFTVSKWLFPGLGLAALVASWALGVSRSR